MQLGRDDEARVAFDRAIALANTAAEAAHIRMHLDRLKRDSAPRARRRGSKRSSFSPCGRRWRTKAPDEGFYPRASLVAKPLIRRRRRLRSSGSPRGEGRGADRKFSASHLSAAPVSIVLDGSLRDLIPWRRWLAALTVHR